MQATISIKRSSEKLQEVLGSMSYDINQSQCFEIVNEISRNQSKNGEAKLKGNCLEVISRLEGYEDWNAYKGDISINLGRAEQFVEEMMEGDAERSYGKFTQRFEKKYLVNFSEKKFQRDVREMREDFGDYVNRQFLGCLAGGSDPEAKAKYPDELRYVWRFVFEKKEVIGVACIYCKGGTYHVSGFIYR